ncbi:pentatricopeptide repeat-containing protein At5g43790 [Magnolia sinica]|uniref:pentatricopeptide repeat-containing protein At5g43790 n=1 Tax=Magnolia sinica TaxID=86752 RepID=UPI00265A2C1B|nr:pentatricopeptide repeat-containing protein At5g43790 [Magnolia sinica]
MRPQSPIFNHPSLLLFEKCKSLKTLKQIHGHMITTGLILHTFPLSRLLLHSSLPPISSTLGLSYATSIFHQITYPPSIFLYNTLISALASQNHTHEALSLYTRVLCDQTLWPNNFTYPSLFKACGAHPSWLVHGRALHAHVLKFLGPTSDHFVLSSLLHFYSRCGKLALSRHLFHQIQNPDLGAWNSIMCAYAHVSTGADTSSIEALLLFNQMLHSLARPNEITLVSLISACADLGALSQGAWAHAYVDRHDLRLNRFVGTALIDMYARCGRADMANQVFDALPRKDTLCYNAMIRALAVHGHGQRAVGLFDQMTHENVTVDNITILAVMCACAHVGWVDEGRRYFDSMKEAYGIEPKIEHYGCLVDLLGRAGRLSEAMDIVRKMPMKPNAVLWRSLLGACRTHDHLELGEHALTHLIQLEPENSGSYVLLSNMYANINRWDDVRRVRKVMKDKGVQKMPGCSFIEMDGAIHEFMMGDRAHPCTVEIYAMLDEMGKKLHACGYRPCTMDVLFDIDEEEKEGAVSYHSEKIAIAFGLLASESGATIRIIKNLRVCRDCHATTKLVSQIYGREIIVRDRIRFHHFRGGTCSCLDYW